MCNRENIRAFVRGLYASRNVRSLHCKEPGRYKEYPRDKNKSELTYLGASARDPSEAREPPYTLQSLFPLNSLLLSDLSRMGNAQHTQQHTAYAADILREVQDALGALTLQLPARKRRPNRAVLLDLCYPYGSTCAQLPTHIAMDNTFAVHVSNTIVYQLIFLMRCRIQDYVHMSLLFIRSASIISCTYLVSFKMSNW